MIGQFAGEIVVLLHQQNRDIAAPGKCLDDALDVLDDRRLYAFSGFIQNQYFGLHHQRPANGELLLLAAGQVAATARLHGCEHRKHLIDLRGNSAGAAIGFAGKPHHQILFDREAGKYFTPLRHVTHAQAHPRERRQTGNVPAIEQYLAAGNRQHTHQTLEQSGFADAVASEQGRDATDGNFEADVAQRVAAAVVLIDIFDFQHALAAQINLDHALVVLDLVHGAFREHTAFVQDSYDLRNRFDKHHIVLHHHQ